jgi:DNA-binding CsgD family transcriptional regulator/pimeloyl-ACP methyl ester carboxylesterase
MAPRVRYARSSNGASIAYATLGEGRAVLCVPPLPFSHLEAGWRVPGLRRWFELLAASAEVVVFDALGTGLSDRGPADFSLEAVTEQVRAVAAHLGLRSLALCGFFNGAAPAIRFAAEEPGLVSRLVLWGGFARGADVYPLPFAAGAADAAAAQWELLIDMAARTWTASAGDEAELTAGLFRAAVEPRSALAAFVAARSYDVSADLPRIGARTLVVQRRDAKTQRLEVARGLASGLRDAELVLLPGEAASPFSGDVASGVVAVQEFLGLPTALATSEGEAAASAPALTPREVEVLALLSRGYSNKEIAGRLELSVHTVERHLTNVYAKIGSTGRTEAVAYAVRHGYG